MKDDRKCLICNQKATHGDFCLRHHHLPPEVKAWAKERAAAGQSEGKR